MNINKPIDNILDLLRTEQRLERHLSDIRQEISAACHNVAARTPGVKTSPDITIRAQRLDRALAIKFHVFAVGGHNE